MAPKTSLGKSIVRLTEAAEALAQALKDFKAGLREVKQKPPFKDQQ